MKLGLKLRESKLWALIYRKRVYILAFLIPATLMFGVYAAFGVFPFGDNSVLVLDLNGQYIYYYEAMRDAFWGHGDASMLYSWGRNLGGEMMGIFGYYLASPFMLIVALFPRAMILESVLIMQLMKLGAAGVAFAFYIKKSKRVSDYNAIIFSVLYALMAFAVVQLMDPMWLDGLIYLPFIIYGVERLVDEKRHLWLIIPLALMFVANFYIGWMVGFFTALYFLYYIFCGRKEEGHDDLKLCLHFALSAVVAVLCAAVVLLPVYYSLKLGKLEFTTPNFELKPQFVLFDFFTKLLPQSYDTVRTTGLPFIYCGTLTFFLIPLYFMNNNIEMRKKIGNGMLLGILLISMYLSTLDIAWHGFQVPNWLPFRYSFMFSFVMLVMAAEAFERMEGVIYRQVGAVMAALLIYVVFIDTKKYSYLPTNNTIWFALLCIIGFAALLYYYKRNTANIKTASLLILLLVVGELFGNSYQTLNAINTDVTYSKHSSYVDYIKDGRDIMAKLTAQDDSFYRTEKTFHRTVNDAMAFGMKGMSHSSSTLNAGPINLLDKLGFTSRGHYVKYKGETYLTDALFGIKYIINKDKPMYYDNEVLSLGEMTIYNNPNALSLGYMASEEIKTLSLGKGNPFVNQNKLLSSLLGTEYVEYFKQIPVGDTVLENLTTSKESGHTKYTPIDAEADAHAEFKMDVPTEDIVYMYLPCEYGAFEKAVNIWVNNEFLDPYFETENYSIKTLGRFTAGEELSVIATLTKEDAYMKDQWFYYLDEALLEADISKLKANQWNVTEVDATHLNGDVTANDGQILFTTIPYEPGWTVTIDGEKTEYIKVVDGLIGIPMTAGTHHVEMSFFPKGMTSGLVLTGVGIIAVVAIAIWDFKKKKVLLRRLYK